MLLYFLVGKAMSAVLPEHKAEDVVEGLEVVLDDMMNGGIDVPEKLRGHELPCTLASY